MIKLEIIRRAAGIFRHNDSNGDALLNAYIEISGQQVIVISHNSQQTLEPEEVIIQDEMSDSIPVTFTSIESLVERLKRMGYRDFKEEIPIKVNSGAFSVPPEADYAKQSNPDSNGNYGSIIYRKGGANGIVLMELSITYDASGNPIEILKV